ncbi:Chagasin family peptidase inhibitor I42 [Chitinophaga sp. YR627]|uniref:protease inhibitor I42 family protein n=1 Tax=Chitinophaga sp. YR627 TaxID=1881041 RepID=UPI0008F441BD|nr:protease inhibitor I42 family protein [Chitinophaga sp. YR627]SFN20877.1 Chagasin family peptidase inhibitor I42 [Chitinophaga sp. YR627]
METESKKIKQGTSLPVILPDLGTAGFHWYYRVSNTDCVEVSPHDEEAEAIRQEARINNEESFVINGKEPGQATVTFEQRRTWETEGPAINSRRFEITVI